MFLPTSQRIDYLSISSVLSEVSLEKVNNFIIVVLNLLDIVSNAINCFFCVVIGLNDTVLEAESARVTVLDVHVLK